MSPRQPARTAQCGRPESRARLAQASKYAEVAALVADEAEAIPESASVAASLAVLAGIAASDAACCAALGERSRGQDHRQAVELVRQVEPGGPDAAKDLRRLLDLKDSAQYGVIHLGAEDVRSALRRCASLVEFARRVVGR